MSQPPARIPEQPWVYPPAHAPAGHAPAPLGGFYARGAQPAVPAGPGAAPPVWHGPPRPQGQGKKVAVFTLAGLGVLIVVFFTMLEAGISGTLVGAIAALVPLALVLGAVRWLDRWEPEPRLYLLASFAWGAGVATATAMALNTQAFVWLSRAIDDPAAVELLGIGLVAPVTEEVLKGGALLALLLWRARLVNSAVDLVVYAATIASGFAFTENILYFARGTSHGVFGAVFFGRAIMSPFAHIMFTSALALVLALVLYSRRRHLLWAFPLGLGVAIVLHSLWNVSATVAGADFLSVFLWLHVPIFAAFIAIVLALRRRERRHIIAHLTAYAEAGWFRAHEVDMLGSLSQRAAARSWAATFGVRAAEARARFQAAATGLALNRQHMAQAARKKPTIVGDLQRIERARLGEVHRLRGELLSHLGTPGAGP